MDIEFDTRNLLIQDLAESRQSVFGSRLGAAPVCKDIRFFFSGIDVHVVILPSKAANVNHPALLLHRPIENNCFFEYSVDDERP